MQPKSFRSEVHFLNSINMVYKKGKLAVVNLASFPFLGLQNPYLNTFDMDHRSFLTKMS